MQRKIQNGVAGAGCEAALWLHMDAYIHARTHGTACKHGTAFKPQTQTEEAPRAEGLLWWLAGRAREEAVEACAVGVLHIKPFFLPVDAQSNQCPRRSFNPEEVQALWSQNYATETLHFIATPGDVQCHVIVLDTKTTTADGAPT